MTKHEVNAALVLAEQGLLLSMANTTPKCWHAEHRIRGSVKRRTLITESSPDQALAEMRHVRHRFDATLRLVPVQP